MSTENVPTKRCDRCGVMETKLRDVVSVELVLSIHSGYQDGTIPIKKALDLCAKCRRRLDSFVARALETPSLDKMPPIEGPKLVETNDDHE